MEYFRHIKQTMIIYKNKSYINWILVRYHWFKCYTYLLDQKNYFVLNYQKVWFDYMKKVRTRTILFILYLVKYQLDKKSQSASLQNLFVLYYNSICVSPIIVLYISVYQLKLCISANNNISNYQKQICNNRTFSSWA